MRFCNGDGLNVREIWFMLEYLCQVAEQVRLDECSGNSEIRFEDKRALGLTKSTQPQKLPT